MLKFFREQKGRKNMGLIKAAFGAASSVLGDQWEEYFYCDSLPQEVLAVKGRKRTSRRGANRKGTENVISNGSVIAVNEGQCMMIVDQGKVVEVCAEPGEYVYDMSSEPSIFYGDLGENIQKSFELFGIRFAFGGEAPKDQRVYYFNTKEIMGNKYGTANPVPFRVVDTNIGLDVDISIRCHGEYSYRIVDPLCFYANVCGNVERAYTRDNLDGMLKSELMTALQPAFAKISEMGIRYSALPGHTAEISDALNQVLSEKWLRLRGIAVASFGVSSVTAPEEEEKMIRDMQKSAVLRNPNMAAATLAGAQADAMRAAAANTAAGPMMAFAGMNMAGQAGGFNAAQLYQMGGGQNTDTPGMQNGGGQNTNTSGMQNGNMPGMQNVQTANAQAGSAGMTGNRNPQTFDLSGAAQSAGSWTCSCGAVNTGKFCPQCGKPHPAAGWTCSCGTVNQGNFCTECGKPRPTGAPLYRCDKCGWEPEDPAHPPKFCPQCGDPFDGGDVR